ncbi:hypothetical protein GVAV_001804 [Gurleya vavrai]
MNILSILYYKNLFTVASPDVPSNACLNENDTIKNDTTYADLNNNLLQQISSLIKIIADIKKNNITEKDKIKLSSSVKKLEFELKSFHSAIIENEKQKLKYFNDLEVLSNPIPNINVLHDEKKKTN